MKKQMKKKAKKILAVVASTAMLLSSLTAFAADSMEPEMPMTEDAVQVEQPELKPEVSVEPAPESKPEAPAPELTPDKSVEPAPNAPVKPTPEEKPDAPAEPAPNVPAEPQPDVPAEPAPEEKPNTPAEPAPDSTPNAPAQPDAPVKPAPEMEQGAGTENNPNQKVDITPPVIEKITVDNKKDVYKPGEEIEIQVYAYDADSKVSQVEAQVYYIKNQDSITSESFRITFTQDPNNSRLWRGKHKVIDSGHTSGSISWVKVIDENGYKTDDYKELLKFDIDTSDLVYPTVKAFNLTPNQQVTNNNWNVSLELAEPIQNLNFIEIAFESSNPTFGRDTVWISVEKDNQTVFTSDQSYPDWMAGARYTLFDIICHYKDGSKKYAQYNFNPKDYWIEFAEREVIGDTEKPKITEIEMDQNGKTLKANDTINFEVKATDNEKLKTDGFLYLRTDAPVENNEIRVTLSLENGIYKGSFTITEDMACSEWYIRDVYIEDESANQADIREYRNDFYEAYPFYVQVVKNGVTQIPSRDVQIMFHRLHDDGYYIPVKTYNKKNVPRRSTVGEIIGEELPVLDDYNGMKFLGWQDMNGVSVNFDSVQRSEYISLYPRYEKMIVPVDANYYLDEKTGTYVTKIYTMEPGATYKDLLDKINKEFKPENMYNKDQFKGWKYSYYAGINSLDEKIRVGTSCTVNAVYEQVPVHLNYYYVDAQGRVQYVNDTYWAEPTDTYGDVAEYGKKFKPESGWKEVNFLGWNVTYFESNAQTLVTNGMGHINFQPKYDKQVMNISYHYANKRGEFIYDEEPIILNQGTTYQDVQKKIETKKVEIYDGLGFKNWTVNFSALNPGEPLDSVIKEDTSFAYASAVTENYMVRYILDDRFKTMEGMDQFLNGSDERNANYDTIICKVMKPGEKVTKPKSVEGFKSVNWVLYPGREDQVEFVVDRDITFFGYGEKATQTPEPNPNPKPEPNPNPKPEPNPGPQVSEVIDQIQNATTPGAEVVVQMQSSTVVAKEILEEAKGKDVNVVLDMGGYSWTINGKDIQDTILKDINLEVKENDNPKLPTVVQNLAGDKPTKQLSLTHNGNFGFKADLTIKVGPEHSGKYGNLFYYDSSGKMVFITNSKVDANGNVSLSFSHASEYVIVMNDEPMSQKDVEEAEEKTEGQAEEKPGAESDKKPAGKPSDESDEKPAKKPVDTKPNKPSTPEKEKSVKTGDDTTTNLFFLVFLMLTSVGIASITISKKRR